MSSLRFSFILRSHQPYLFLQQPSMANTLEVSVSRRVSRLRLSVKSALKTSSSGNNIAQDSSLPASVGTSILALYKTPSAVGYGVKDGMED